MKVKNIIAEALDLTGLFGQLNTLKKNYSEMEQSIKNNPMMVKEYASQMSSMSAAMTALEKQLGGLFTQQKAEQTMAAKQQQLNQQNSTKPGTTQSLASQAVKPANPIAPPTAPPTTSPTASPTAPVK